MCALTRFIHLHGTDAVRIKCARCGAPTRIKHMAAREMAHDTRLKPICRACESKGPQDPPERRQWPRCDMGGVDDAEK